MKTVGNKIVVKQIKNESKTEGGIIIPDEVDNTSQRGVVILTGPGNPNQDLIVKTGDNIIYRKGCGSPIKVDNEDLLVMVETDILVIL